jgi:hypothetical protein
MAITSSMPQFFENGFLILGTSTNSTGVLGLDNISLSYDVGVEEIKVFENNFAKTYVPTDTDWKISAGGYVLVSGLTESIHPFSGNTHFVSVTDAQALLETAKARATTTIATLKLATGNYQSGSAIITSIKFDASATSPMKFSIELQGTGALTKSAT